MRNSERYQAQADTVMRLADRADTETEREVYLNIAEGWRRLAAEAKRNEGTKSAEEMRSFKPKR